MRNRAACTVLVLPVLILALAGCLGVTSGLPAPAPSTTPSSEPAQPQVSMGTEGPAATRAPTEAAVQANTPAPTNTPPRAAVPTLVLGMRDTKEMIPAKLVRVVDGTTIEVTVDGKDYLVRYIGVNPIGDGTATTAKNKQLVSGEALKLVRDATDADPQGTLLRYVYAQAYMVNAELARLGYAQALPMPPDTLYQELISGMEREARDAKRGLWAKTGAASPRTTPAR